MCIKNFDMAKKKLIGRHDKVMDLTYGKKYNPKMKLNAAAAGDWLNVFSAAPSAVLASQSPISIFDSPSRLSKVLWGYWRRTASKFPALRAVWFADLRIVASQFKSPSRALIISQAVSLAYMIIPRQRVQTEI